MTCIYELGFAPPAPPYVGIDVVGYGVDGYPDAAACSGYPAPVAAMALDAGAETPAVVDAAGLVLAAAAAAPGGLELDGNVGSPFGIAARAEFSDLSFFQLQRLPVPL